MASPDELNSGTSKPSKPQNSPFVINSDPTSNANTKSNLLEIQNSNTTNSGTKESLNKSASMQLKENFDAKDIDDQIETLSVQDEDYVKSDEWYNKDKHIFVLSSAGKPIYARYGNEDKLVTMFGVMQALVSVVQDQGDTLQSFHAGSTNYVFLIKNHLILVSISKTKESVSQLTSQLNYVYNQIASTLTLSRLNLIYEQRRNYDLRRLLVGVERLIDHLIDFNESEPAFLLGAIQCLPLAASVRESISSAIIHSCSKIKNLVFAILIGNSKLITLVRMKKYAIHPADLHLIFNLVQASESLKAAESWTPLCLPRFDGSGFLYGHVSYLSEDCQACLLLLTIEKDVFFTLSEAKQRIVEKLRRNNALEAINESLNANEETCTAIGFPEIRHFLYKSKWIAQFHQPAISIPYKDDKQKLLEMYKDAHHRMHSTLRPLKFIFERTANESLLAWDAKGFELYAVFEPLVDNTTVVASVAKLINWVSKKEDRLFHLNAPNF